jgi:hypothetical protein
MAASSSENLTAMAHGGAAPAPLAHVAAQQHAPPQQQPPPGMSSPTALQPSGSSSPPLPHAEGGRVAEMRASESGGVRLSSESFSAGLGLPPKGGGPSLASLGAAPGGSGLSNGHHAPGVASGVTRTSSDLSLPRRSEHGGVEQPATSAEGRAKTIAETLDLALNKQLSDLSKSNALISGMGMKS